MSALHPLRIGLALWLCLASRSVLAAITDIAASPLVVASPSSVKANLLFILDDSGSMRFDFMPDHVNYSASGSSDVNVCRSGGAGINSGSAYSGNFSNRCCQNSSDASATCWTGNAPFTNKRGHPPFLSSSFNGMAYNPATRYLPPVDANGQDYPNQNSAATAGWTSVKIDAYQVENNASINLLTSYPDTEWCTSNSYTNCLRNGNYVLPGMVGGLQYNSFHETTASGTGFMAVGAPDAPTTEARSWGPHYYNILPGEYCNGLNLRVCQATAGASFSIPAPLRWCNSDTNARAAVPAAGSCQATRTNVYINARYPTKYFSAGAAGSAAIPETAAFAQFTFSTPSCSLALTALTVSGVNLLASVTSSTNNRDTLGNSVAARINSGSSGYSAVASGGGRTVRITAPAGLNTSASISFTRTPLTCSVTLNPATPAFSGYVAAQPAVAAIPAGFPGSFERVDIIPSRNSYPKTGGRSDCAGASCTYAEEMSNFANWWTYYHSRMQSMKSSASRAFAALGNNRRVGFISINNNTGSDFLNLDTFENSQKVNWFSKLTHAIPNGGTPLRSSLSRAGRLYAGKLNGQTLNGSLVNDPMQYSCQRNFTILSTDGFWNDSSNPKRLDNSTDIGNQDGTMVRPMLDGNNTANTLADTAAYYFKTDLRTGSTGSAACLSGSSGSDVCGNSSNLLIKADEVQSMRTFTLGLGASGYMQFRSDYLTASSGDFFSVKQGATTDLAAGVCTWQSSGACNWPIPAADTLTAIDDLWHAAVNGGGSYFSASNPTDLYTGLASALAAIDVQTKVAAAATTSNPNVSAGDNQVFVSNFNSGEWSGDLQSQRLDIIAGTVDANQVDWSARDLLDGTASRTLYMFAPANANRLKSFNWASLSASEQAYFSLSYITATGRALSQFCSFGIYCLSAADQSQAAGERLLNFLRGERGDEGDISEPLRYFRLRAHKLGDIVSSEAVYVAQGLASYTDAGYAAYKQTLQNRPGMVYVGANDGMLHAFSAATGQEQWAYLPTLMLPKLYRLADKQYSTQHEYFVDGTATVQEIFDGSRWRTLLVGGLGAGGRGYFALDVTDPAAPKALWEFSHDNLGLSMGKAEIGKLSDGSWAVFLPSGYNNVAPGDGHGRLFILNAVDGSLIRSIDTGAGSSGTPAGLAQIRAWVDNGDVNNLVQRVYAGDNLGNVWRFDVNNAPGIGAPGYDAQRLATLKSAAGLAQPVSSRPELGQVGSLAMVYLGTGRYLGLSDLADSNVQTIYAIKDRLGTEDFGDPRLPANAFVKQTLSAGTCPAGTAICSAATAVRVIASPQAVDLNVNGGWYIDLPEALERVNTDPQLALGTLAVNSNVIEPGNICKVGGSSYANYLDYRSGAPISTAKGVASLPLGDSIATRPALIKLPNNKIISISRLSDNRTVSTVTPIETSNSSTRRLSWRDLTRR